MPLIRGTPPSQTGSGAPQISAATSLIDGTAEERWQAARALGGQPEAIDQLAAALATEGDARVRAAIFTSLALTDSVASADAVVPYIRSDDASLRTGALDALRAMPTAIRARLPALLADPDPDVRLLLCDLARELPAAIASPLMAELIDREADPNVCAAAVEVLAERGEPDVVPALRRCAERFADNPFLGFAIAAAIGRIGPN